MKKHIHLLLMACIWLVMSCVPAVTYASSLPDADLELVFNGDIMLDLNADETGMGLIGDNEYDGMAGLYVEALQVAEPLTVQVRAGRDGYQSMLGLRITSLSDFQSKWHEAREGRSYTNVPVTLQGRKASARFDSDAQNAVRRAAALPAASQLVQWLFRSAMAAVTGNNYANSSLSVGAAVQDWTELTAADFTAQQLNVFGEYTIYGGVRARVAMAIGSNIPSEMTNLGRGEMVLETELTTVPDLRDKALVALRVDDSGKVQRYPATLNGTKASVVTNQFGDYIFVVEDAPVIPTTGDSQPIALWMALMAASVVALLMLGKRRMA